MADTYKRLTRTNFSSSTATTIYTVPASTTTIVKKIVISNNGVASGTAKIYHVASGGVADAQSVILPTIIMAPNETGMDDAPFIMEAGDTLRVQGDNTNLISISVYGLEMT